MPRDLRTEFESLTTELESQLQEIEKYPEILKQIETQRTTAQEMEKKVVDREIEVRRKKDALAEELRNAELQFKEWRKQEQKTNAQLSLLEQKQHEIDLKKQEHLKMEEELRKKQLELQDILNKEKQLKQLEKHLEEEKIAQREREIVLDNREKNIALQAERLQRRLTS